MNVECLKKNGLDLNNIQTPIMFVIKESQYRYRFLTLKLNQYRIQTFLWGPPPPCKSEPWSCHIKKEILLVQYLFFWNPNIEMKKLHNTFDKGCSMCPAHPSPTVPITHHTSLACHHLLQWLIQNQRV